MLSSLRPMTPSKGAVIVALSSLMRASSASAPAVRRVERASSRARPAVAPCRESDSDRLKFSRASTSADSALSSSARKVTVSSSTKGSPAVTACPCSNATLTTRPAISGWTTTESDARSVPAARTSVAAPPVSASAVSTGTGRLRGPWVSRASEAGSDRSSQPATAPAAASASVPRAVRRRLVMTGRPSLRRD
jgi:hypothetical protein